MFIYSLFLTKHRKVKNTTMISAVPCKNNRKQNNNVRPIVSLMQLNKGKLNYFINTCRGKRTCSQSFSSLRSARRNFSTHCQLNTENDFPGSLAPTIRFMVLIEFNNTNENCCLRTVGSSVYKQIKKNHKTCILSKTVWFRLFRSHGIFWGSALCSAEVSFLILCKPVRQKHVQVLRKMIKALLMDELIF